MCFTGMRETIQDDAAVDAVLFEGAPVGEVTTIDDDGERGWERRGGSEVGSVSR